MNSLGDTSLGHFLSPMNQRSLENDETVNTFPSWCCLGNGAGDGISPLRAVAPSISQPPLVGETLSSVSPCPAPLEDFGICPQPRSLHRSVRLAAIPREHMVGWGFGHVMCPAVPWGNEVQARGSIQVSSLCCHCCPLRAHPASLLPIPVPPITLPCAWPWMHKGWLLLGVLLNSHLTLTSACGFSRGTRVLVFVFFLFWFY